MDEKRIMVYLEVGNGDRINPKNINFDTFNKCPVLLFDHNFENIIGNVSDLKVSKQNMTFVPRTNIPKFRRLIDEDVVFYGKMGGFVKGRNEKGEITEFELIEISI